MKLCPHCYEEIDQLIEFKIGQIVKSKNLDHFINRSIPKGLSPDSYYKISNVTLTLIYIINDYGEEDNYLISDFLPVSIDELILLLNNKEK